MTQQIHIIDKVKGCTRLSHWINKTLHHVDINLSLIWWSTPRNAMARFSDGYLIILKLGCATNLSKSFFSICNFRVWIKAKMPKKIFDAKILFYDAINLYLDKSLSNDIKLVMKYIIKINNSLGNPLLSEYEIRKLILLTWKGINYSETRETFIAKHEYGNEFL